MKGNDKLDAIYNGVNEHFKLFPISKELKRIKENINYQIIIFPGILILKEY
jgi:hypothetical protein